MGWVRHPIVVGFSYWLLGRQCPVLDGRGHGSAEGASHTSLGQRPTSVNLTVLLFVAVDVDLDMAVDLDYPAMRELSQT